VQGLQLPGRPLSWLESLVSIHQSQRNYEQNLAEMTPEELSAVIDRWEGCGGCLTVKNQWGLLTGDDGVILCMSVFSNVLMFHKS
jgi:hypothetical protein